MTVDIATFDLNCDMGECLGDGPSDADERIMPLVTSANVACGFHGGDPVRSGRPSARQARRRRRGASVLPDLLGFAGGAWR